MLYLKNEFTVDLCLIRYSCQLLAFSCAALVVRFLTKRFIGDYERNVGKFIFNWSSIHRLHSFVILSNHILICVFVSQATCTQGKCR